MELMKTVAGFDCLRSHFYSYIHPRFSVNRFTNVVTATLKYLISFFKCANQS
jgi:hypothetical protein